MNFRQICPLTTGIDTVAGTSSTINGIIIDESTVSQQTWSLSDSITGTAGTTDIVNARIIGDASSGVSRTGLQTSAVETISFNYSDANDGADSNTISASSFTGITKLAVTGSSNINTTSTVRDTVAFTGVAAGVALELGSNTAQTSVTLTNTGTAATGDAITLNTVGGSSGVVTLRDANTTEGFVTVNIATSGSTASTIKSLDGGTSNTTVNVTGDQALTITDALASTVKTLDASKASGAITAGVVAISTLVAKGGSAITDVLNLTVDSTITSGAVITGFETVNLNTTGTGVIDSGLFTGATAFNVISDAATNTSLTIQNAAAGQALNFVGSKSTLANQTFDPVTQSLKTNNTASDGLAITINNGGTATTKTATIGAINVDNYEVVTLTAGEFGTGLTTAGITTGALKLSNTAASSITINASTNLTIGGLDAVTASLAAVNVGGSTGAVNLGTIANTGAMTYTGSQGVDTLTMGVVAAGVTQTFNLGTGNDVITSVAVSTLSGTIAVNGEAGDDTIILFGTVNTQNVFNITGGDGSDTIRTDGTNNAASTIDSLVGVEKFSSVGSGTTTIAGSSTAANNSIEITQIGSGITAFTTTAGQTVSIAGVTAVGTVGATTLTLTGLTGNETLTGSSTVGTGINGAAGDDTITGGAGADTITGGAGNDTITGGEGIDGIDSDAGDDTITLTETTSVADTLQFDLTTDGNDTITGFISGTDILDFDGILDGVTKAYAEIASNTADITSDANVIVVGGTSTIAVAAALVAADVTVTGTVGLIVVSNGTNTLVYHSTNLGTDGTETLLATLTGISDATTLVTGDFIFA